MDTAREVFCESDVHITTDGHRYLGGVIGSDSFYSQRYKIEFLATSCCLFCLLPKFII